MEYQQIQSLLDKILNRCEQGQSPLSKQQREVIEQVLLETLTESNDDLPQEDNPLDELSPEQREALLEFIIEQGEEPWKSRLLDDWLKQRDSGKVQFLRDEYGPQWLNRVEPHHIAQYLESSDHAKELNLKIGDRIEVCNLIWEWVQDANPENQDWYPCTVINLFEEQYQGYRYQNCIIRFDNGAELEIPGIYDWNQYNWRWAQNR